MAIRNTATRIVVSLVTFVALEAVSLVLISNASSAHNLFFSRWATSVSAAFYRMAYNVSSYFSLRKTNEELNELNFELFRRMAVQNTSADSFTPDSEHSFQYQKAKVIGAKYGSLHNYFILNKGLRDGVTQNCGVITGSGVIGVVQAVGANVCYVESFQNFEMSVSVKVGREGVTGPLVWDGRSSHRAVMHDIPIHYAFEKGDTVYTSGYSSIFPGDIPLGTVVSSTEEMGTSATLKISLFEDFRTLNYVIICKSSYFYEIKKLVEENAE